MTTQSSEALGERADTTVSVSRVVSRPIDSVWGALMKPHGAEALLGEGGELGQKGDPWRAADGTHGVTRSFHPLEQIRFSWHADADAPATVVELDLVKVDDESTKLDITQTHVPADADTAALTQHWEDALARIDADAV